VDGHGDRVVVRIERVKEDGRVQGRIVQILERANQQIVGRYDRDESGMGYVVPFDRRVLMDIVVPAGMEGGAAPGEMVVVDLTRWPTATRGPIGRVTEVSSLFEADHGSYARWRLVAQAALELGRPPEPWRGAVVVSITDYFARPLSHYVAGKRDGLLKRDAPLRPVKLGGSNKPDWDKSARATCDNLKIAGWIADDGLVVEGSLSQEYDLEPCKMIQVCGVMNGPGEIERFERGEYANYEGSFKPAMEEIERRILLNKARNGEAARAKRRGKLERAGTRLKARRGAVKP
jgi:Holliday junction resolvase RusA-like endonuclease